MLSILLKSPSSSLESFLLHSARLPVAGRFSYPPAISSSPTSANSPQSEADIGLQNPGSRSRLSSAKVNYLDLASSSTPAVGDGSRVSAKRQVDEGKSNDRQIKSPRRRVAARSTFEWRGASISQVLGSPPPSSKAEGVEICAINIFSQDVGCGLGLGLTIPPTLAKVPRSTDEKRIIPITEVAPGSLSSPNSSSQLPTSSTAEIPTPTRATAAQAKYPPGLGNGRPPRASRTRLSSIPEGIEAHPIDAPLHAELGLGLPSVLHQAVQPASSSSQTPASPRPKMPFKARLESTVHQLFGGKFAKRALCANPGARSPSVEEKGCKGRTASWVQQQQQHRQSSAPSPIASPIPTPMPTANPTPTPIPRRAQMSPMMLLAAQSVMEDQRKFRKKEKITSPMSPMMRLASQVVDELQEEQRREQTQIKKSRFLF
ncbi:hypothetical protein K438DRAFT_1959886 [Mycena galopus ATCC 62051]|nr:hypothetical protein K438DRAFT_1959886 [Mycena galopus ATCC 62051]